MSFEIQEDPEHFFPGYGKYSRDFDAEHAVDDRQWPFAMESTEVQKEHQWMGDPEVEEGDLGGHARLALTPAGYTRLRVLMSQVDRGRIGPGDFDHTELELLGLIFDHSPLPYEIDAQPVMLKYLRYKGWVY